MFALSTPYIKLVVNKKPSGTGLAMPALPVVQIIVVNPVGIDFLLLSAVCGNHTVVVPMIVIQQDSTYLSAQESPEFSHHSLWHLQSGSHCEYPTVVGTV